MVIRLALSWCSTRIPASCEEEPAAPVVIRAANRMIPSSCFSLIITLSPHAARIPALRDCEGAPTTPSLRISQPYDGYTTSPGFGPYCKSLFTTWTHLPGLLVHCNVLQIGSINLG